MEKQDFVGQMRNRAKYISGKIVLVIRLEIAASVMAFQWPVYAQTTSTSESAKFRSSTLIKCHVIQTHRSQMRVRLLSQIL